MCGIFAGRKIPLDWYPITRDCVVYGITVFLLIIVLLDEKVRNSLRNIVTERSFKARYYQTVVNEQLFIFLGVLVRKHYITRLLFLVYWNYVREYKN